MITLPETFNVATYFVDRNVLEGRSTKIAIECGGECVSYQQLLERTNRAGNAFRRLGMRREERVLLLLLDTPEFLYCFFGAIKIGAAPVPTNTLLKPHEYEYVLNDSRAGVVVVSEALLPQVEAIPREKLSYLREIVVVGAPDPHHLSLTDLMVSASPQLTPEPTSKDEVAFWLYSSGSTGTPKGCLHLHHDMVVCSELYAKNILRMNESDRCYSVARLFFAYGLGNAGYFPLACGATTILSPDGPRPLLSLPISSVTGRLCCFPYLRITPDCWLIEGIGDESSTSPACVRPFRREKPCLRRYLTASNSALVWRFSMLWVPRKPCRW